MSFFSNLFQSRRNAMQKTAYELGMDFYTVDDHHFVSLLEEFKLFNHGRRKRIKNMMISEDESLHAEFRVFDYHFVTGGGKSTRFHKQTVFFIQSRNLSLPQFLIKPEHFFHRIGKFLGFQQDIEFEKYDQFNKQYLVTGQDENLVRDTFSHDILHFFTVEKDWSLEGLNYMMIFYQNGKRQKPETIMNFMDKGLTLCDMFIKGGTTESDFV